MILTYWSGFWRQRTAAHYKLLQRMGWEHLPRQPIVVCSTETKHWFMSSSATTREE